MKQKILFYLLVFSILINVYLIADYGKRLAFSQSKIESQSEKIKKLQDSIQLIQSVKAVSEATEWGSSNYLDLLHVLVDRIEMLADIHFF